MEQLGKPAPALALRGVLKDEAVTIQQADCEVRDRSAALLGRKAAIDDLLQIGHPMAAGVLIAMLEQALPAANIVLYDLNPGQP
jgi:hypothetical protein